MEKEIEKVKFKNLSTSLKILVVTMWIYTGLWGIAFLITFIGGLLADL